MPIEHVILPNLQGVPERSGFKCPRCSEVFDPGIHSALSADSRASSSWGKARLIQPGEYPGRTHTHTALEAFVERHKNCIGPEEVTVSERGITCIDRRRVKL